MDRAMSSRFFVPRMCIMCYNGEWISKREQLHGPAAMGLDPDAAVL